MLVVVLVVLHESGMSHRASCKDAGCNMGAENRMLSHSAAPTLQFKQEEQDCKVQDFGSC